MLQIIPVSESNFPQAVEVYSVSWQKSHAGICTPEFLQNRDCSGYLRRRMEGLYLVCDGMPVGVFYLLGREFGDLYIHPEHTGKGYGTACVKFAQAQSRQLRLSVLSSNSGAIQLYRRLGFSFSGEDRPLKNGLWECEMIYSEKDNG